MRLLGAYLYAVICLSAALAAAAPAPPAGTDWERLAQVQQEARALDARDPDKALAVLYGLFRERPNLEPEPAVLACSDIVKLQTKAGRIDLATELCTWALNKYAWHPAIVCVAADQAEVLIGQQRFTEATDLLDRYWDRMALTYRAHSNRALRAYCAALAGDGRTSEIPLRLTRALREVPSLLDEGQQEPVGWIYNQLLFYLSPKDEELLRWARVRFAACAFDARSIERSVRMLLRVWRTHDPSGEPIRQFLAWQQGQGTRDPVSAVPLPSQDAALRKAQLTSLQGWGLAHDRISVYILAGDYGGALSEGRGLLLQYPESPSGIREVCRVWKAVTNNLERSNHFLEQIAAPQDAARLAQILDGFCPGPAAVPTDADTHGRLRSAAAGIPAVSPERAVVVAADAKAGTPALVAVSALGERSPLASPPATVDGSVLSQRLSKVIPGVVPAGKGTAADSPEALQAALAKATKGAARIGTLPPAKGVPGASAEPVRVRLTGSGKGTVIPGAVSFTQGAPASAAEPVRVAPTGSAKSAALPNAIPSTNAKPGRAAEPVRVGRTGSAKSAALPNAIPSTNAKPARAAEPVRVASLGPGRSTATPSAVPTTNWKSPQAAEPARVGPARAGNSPAIPGPVSAGKAKPARMAEPVRMAQREAGKWGPIPGAVPSPKGKSSQTAAPVRGAQPEADTVAVPTALPRTARPPLSGSTPGKGVSPVTATARPPARVGDQSPRPVQAAAPTVGVTLELLSAGQITTSAVWERRMLNADDIVAAIGRMSAQEMDDGAPLATALAELLAQHFADRLADPTRLNARVRLCLAHYFRHTKDPRAGVWYEELLAAPDPGIDTWYVIRGLAAFYRETGEPRRAAETWLRCQESAAMNADRVESARISAARMFASAGDTSTAEETYRRVVDSANPVSVSLARYGLASLLMQQGKHQDARRLLQEPLPGASSETARSLLLSGLTESYYLAGDFAEARRSAKEAHSGALPPPLPEDVQAVLQTAETCVRWIDSWQREPLQSSVAELRIDVKAPGAPAAGAFTVRSFRGVPLVVTTDWPQLAALAVPLPNRGNPYAVEREVKVTVEAAGTKADRDATVSITSPAIPGAELRIRVKLVLHASGR